jgi:hypothetical protein
VAGSDVGGHVVVVTGPLAGTVWGTVVGVVDGVVLLTGGMVELGGPLLPGTLEFGPLLTGPVVVVLVVVLVVVEKGGPPGPP